MLLTIDVGNTLTDLCFWEDEAIVAKSKFETKPQAGFDEIKDLVDRILERKGIAKGDVSRICISSVVPSLSSVYREMAEEVFLVRPVTVGPGLKTGLALKVDDPKTVGSDIIADCVGAREKYGNGLFVADLGTANKYILIDEDGAFAGLSIAPGLSISNDALTGRTAALPSIEMTPPKRAIGKNTVDCMASGLILGTAYEVKGFLEAFQKECGMKLRPILTGGNAKFVSRLLGEFEFDEDILAYGLLVISRRVGR